MSEHKHKKTNPKNLLNWVALSFIVFSLGISGFFAWQKYDLGQKQKQLTQAIETQKQTLIELKQREQIGERMRAAEILNKAEKYRTNWSVVVKDLNETFTDRSPVVFKSVSVSAEGEISVSAETNDILSAAGFLVLIERSEKFDNGFIGQISPQGEGAEQIYTFSATFDYLETDPS